MPVHDWTRAPAGFFHHFHQRWSGSICDALNDGLLPDGCYALVEQNTIGLEPDVLTFEVGPRRADGRESRGAVALADAPLTMRFVSRDEDAAYTAKPNRVAVRNSGGEVVAVIEIVSPGNKRSARAMRSFLRKTAELVGAGVNLLIVDLFPPSRRDPQGVHPLIWSDVKDEPFDLPPDKPLTLAAYVAAPPTTAYVEPVAVGDALPDMPVFLDADTYVPVPLGPTYEATWERCPKEFKDAVLGRVS